MTTTMLSLFLLVVTSYVECGNRYKTGTRGVSNRDRNGKNSAISGVFRGPLGSSGGEGIRTLETFRFAGFQDRCDRPLCHPSGIRMPESVTDCREFYRESRRVRFHYGDTPAP